MSELEISEYRDFETFAREWQGDETEARLRWQLLGELDEQELLIRIPMWLGTEKVGFVDGETPTEFVGRIERETEKAIRFADSAAAPQLMTLAHRIHKLEEGMEKAAGDESRHEWLADRLQENRRAFEQRDDVPSLSDEWLPKSQIERAVRRVG